MIFFVWSEVRFYVPKSSIQKPLKLYLVWLAKDFICKWQKIYFFKLILSFWFFLHHRDNGISIQISILQWGIEIVNQIVYVCFVLFLHGNSYFIDRLMGLYVISFTMITCTIMLLPAAILMTYRNVFGPLLSIFATKMLLSILTVWTEQFY